jgi:hypothetical protein
MDWTKGLSSFDSRQRQRGFFLQPVYPDRLSSPTSLLSNGYRGPFPGDKARTGRDTDHSPHLVPRSWMSRSYTPLPLRLQMCVDGLIYLFFSQLMGQLHLLFAAANMLHKIITHFIYLEFIWRRFFSNKTKESNERVASEWWIGKDLEGSSCGLI